MRNPAILKIVVDKLEGPNMEFPDPLVNIEEISTLQIIFRKN